MDGRAHENNTAGELNNPEFLPDTRCPGRQGHREFNRIGHAMAERASRIVQREDIEGVAPRWRLLCRCRAFGTCFRADKRRRIPAGRPEDTSAPQVARPFRSGRCASWAFSARTDTVRIRASMPMIAVKAARVGSRVLIVHFLFTWVNGTLFGPYPFECPDFDKNCLIFLLRKSGTVRMRIADLKIPLRRQIAPGAGKAHGLCLPHIQPG